MMFWDLDVDQHFVWINLSFEIPRCNFDLKVQMSAWCFINWVYSGYFCINQSYLYMYLTFLAETNFYTGGLKIPKLVENNNFLL